MLDNDLSIAGIHHLNIHSLKNVHHYQPEKISSIQSNQLYLLNLHSVHSVHAARILDLSVKIILSPTK